MSEKIVNWIVGSLGSFIAIPFMKEIIVFVISMCPILELRGGLIAASLLDMDPWISYLICMIGNILPIPFILWLINKILNWMRNSKSKKINGIARWLDKKVDKHKGQIEKYGYWGLVIFVGIPLPGTGAWTGCLIAAVLEMDKKKSLLAAVVGVFIASVIMMLLSFGILSNIL
ncbi:MAG: small multi-drug export protein [Bacilli bacterium]|nr:small multi-drug export protein [Bacilli bacterium]